MMAVAGCRSPFCRSASSATYAVFIAATAVLAPNPGATEGLSAMARDLTLAAQQAHLNRIAVLPFVSTADEPPASGRLLAEILLTDMVREKRVAIVERAFYQKLARERDRAAGGSMEPSDRRSVGLVLAVDGLVTGTYLRRRGDILVSARLIEVNTGLVLAAGERTLNLERLNWEARQPGSTPQGGAPDRIPEYCVGAEEIVDRIENNILELSARYWASQLLRGATLSGLQDFPGEDISDVELRQTLYDRMNYWYARHMIPELGPEELQSLFASERRALLLYRGCHKREGV